MKIITVILKNEYDIIIARQKAKKLASSVGLSITDQTRFVTGVSEITRNAIMYANGGKVEFFIVQNYGQDLVQAVITDNGKEDLTKILESSNRKTNGMGIGISGTEKIVDYFSIKNKDGNGNSVTLSKKIPISNIDIKGDLALESFKELIKEDPQNFFEEIQQQNQLLMQTLEKLEKQDAYLKKQLEETTRLNKELENSNQELKDFAYVVSHDLKAPLRAISSLAGWIADDYSEVVDDEGKNMIDTLIGRIHRMNNLIDGILQYSRVGRVKEEKVLIDTNNIIKDVIRMIDPPEHIKILVENNLPHILFEETRICQVFQNLIGNAVKYMDKDNGLVKVGCTEEEDMYKFYVEDNGPGIEEKYYGKIFKIFQALSARDKVESTGIGLTIVKKIIELYGGQIWLKSNRGEGTTFFFTVPKSTN